MKDEPLMSYITEYQNSYNARIARQKEFYDNQEYLNTINKLVGKNINVYSGEWTEDIDLAFDFLYYNTSEIIYVDDDFEREITIQ